MEELILDTSAYSALMRGNVAVRDALENATRVYLNPVIIGELLSGFKRGTAEKKNLKILGDFLKLPVVNVLQIDEDTSEHYALIVNELRKRGTPVTTNDLWIAATAQQYILTVLTADTDFLKIKQISTNLITP